MDTAAKNMDTYVVTYGPLADEGHNLRDENIKGTEKWKRRKSQPFSNKKVGSLAGVTGLEPAASGVTGQRLMAVFCDTFDFFTCIYRHLPTMTYIKKSKVAGSNPWL